MIKLIICVTRRSDLTREQFQDYWLNKHAPLYMKHADRYRTKKYLQCHTIDTPLNDAIRESRGMGPAYDGVAEVWFESEQDFIEAMGTPEGQELSEMLLADEANFLDHAKCSAFVTQEHEFPS
ncbi:MAG: EthD family reductase [Phycisphaera sp.]|nr:MAG: EthD family reductase [Phycisphaera sp.]